MLSWQSYTDTIPNVEVDKVVQFRHCAWQVNVDAVEPEIKELKRENSMNIRWNGTGCW